MKKAIAILMSLISVLCLASCGGTGDNSTEAPSNGTSAPVSESSKNDSAKTKKTLVVYYSASGNTKRVANAVASAADADLFEIVPKDVYSDGDLDWTDSNSRVNREHNDEALREVALESTAVPDWDSYDTVFIGYPIWWGIAAWPTSSFVKANSFEGKTVIPFCTSASSPFGESGSLLQKTAGSGNWQEGRRFSSGASDSEVQEWVESFK